MDERIKYGIDGTETYNAVECWVLSMTTTMKEEGAEMKTVVMWWMAKSDLHVVHGRIEAYVNDYLMFEQEFDPADAPEQAGEPPQPADINYAVGYETVTVPAGTFANCIKVRIEVAAEGIVSYSWAHPAVPIFGMVKSEIYKDGELMMTVELIAYGG